eukprot:183631-Rhodomonas_salina.2
MSLFSRYAMPDTDRARSTVQRFFYVRAARTTATVGCGGCLRGGRTTSLSGLPTCDCSSPLRTTAIAGTDKGSFLSQAGVGYIKAVPNAYNPTWIQLTTKPFIPSQAFDLDVVPSPCMCTALSLCAVRSSCYQEAGINTGLGRLAIRT